VAVAAVMPQFACARAPLANPVDHATLSGLEGDMALRLELVVNGVPSGRVVPVIRRAGHYLVAGADLRAVHITRLPAGDPVDISAIRGIHAAYDEAAQRLMIDVPAGWLPAQTIASDDDRGRIAPESSFGGLLNYDLYLSSASRGESYGSLWHEARLFGGFGIASSTGTLRFGLSENAGPARYTRYDTSWTYIDEAHVRTWEVGDFVTRTLGWTDPVRLGGAQLSRDFTVRPDIVTYPLPRFSGAAAVPSAVDLFINGYRSAGGDVAPGPFTLTDMPYVNGAGEAVIVTTDVQGRRVSTSVPFYVASTLLRPGLSDYALSAGTIRRAYGERNFSYGAAAATGAWRRGLTDSVTVEAAGELSDGHALAGLGTVVRLGTLGVVDLSAAINRTDDRTGQQLTIGYQYSGRTFNLTARHIRRSAAFRNLSSQEFAEGVLPDRQTQANGALLLGDRWGTIGAGYTDARRGDDRFRLVNLSYNRVFWGRASLYVSASQEVGRGQTTGLLQLVMPLGRNATTTAGVERLAGGDLRGRVGWNRSVPSDGGLGASVALADGGGTGRYYQGDLTWRTSALQVQGGLYGTGGNRVGWGEVSGALVAMDGGMFAANRINDGFALVSTDGEPGIPILFENRPVGVTDGKGHLLIPWATSYYPAKYAIDPGGLPIDVSVPVIETRAAVRRGSGRLVKFAARRVNATSVLIHDAEGRPLPAGSTVTTADGAITWIGWDGTAYLENAQHDNRLTVTRADGTTCRARFSYDIRRAGTARTGPVPCR
jgi:outer membrane usher protein